MSTIPKCEVCGTHHHGHQAHTFELPTFNVPVNTPVVDTTQTVPVDTTKVQIEQLKTYISELEAENESLRAQLNSQRLKKREQMKRYRERKNTEC